MTSITTSPSNPMYQASNPPRATRGDMAARENTPVAPNDLPAPGKAVAVPQAGTATASTDQARWIIDHAHEDLKRHGKEIPPFMADLVRDLLNPPAFAHASENRVSETVELSTAQIARRMGCSAQWVRHLCQVGKLRARRAGRYWLITVEEEHEDDHERRHTG